MFAIAFKAFICRFYCLHHFLVWFSWRNFLLTSGLGFLRFPTSGTFMLWASCDCVSGLFFFKECRVLFLHAADLSPFEKLVFKPCWGRAWGTVYFGVV